MARGGHREGSGRKSKADEVALIERLSPLDETAFIALKQGVEAKDFAYVKLFMEYRFGKPSQSVNLNGSMEFQQITGMIVK